MRVWIRRHWAAVKQRTRVVARDMWRELPNNVVAAVIAQGVVTGDLRWIGVASFVLVMLAILRR